MCIQYPAILFQFFILTVQILLLLYIYYGFLILCEYVIPQFHWVFCIKMQEYKIFSVKFYHLGKFHIVDICLINKSKILKSTGCASHDFTQILINTLLLIRNLQYLTLLLQIPTEYKNV